MPALADYVTRLIADSSQYSTGIDKAIGGNRALGGSIDAIIGKLEREEAALRRAGKTTADNIREAANQPGADPAKIRQAWDSNIERERRYEDAQVQSMRRVAQERRDTNNVERQLASQRLGEPDAFGGMSRKSMIATEAMRGLEDAVAGFTNNGLKGMLQATTNNVGQIGALIGGTAGLTLGMGSIAAMAAVTLVPMLQKWASGTDVIIKRERELAQEAKKTTDAYLGEIERRANASFRKQDIGRGVRRSIEDPTLGSEQLRREEDAARERGLDARRQQNVEKLTIVEIERQQLANSREIPFERAAGNKDEADRLERENRELEKQKRESLERMRLAKADAIHADQQLDALASARAKAQAREMADAKILEAERERNELRAMRQRDLERDQKMLGGAGGGLQGAIRDLDPNRADSIERERTRAERQAALRPLFERGILKPEEYHQASRAIDAAAIPQPQHRPPDGSTGFSSADVRTSGGANAMFKAMRAAQQEKTDANDPAIKAAKANAEYLAGILMRIEQATKENQAKVIEFL